MASDENALVADADINPIAHIIAPIAAVGATLLVRKWMNAGYRRVASGPVPTPGDPTISFTRALTWTVAISATAAVAEVVVFRLINHIGTRGSSS